MEQKMVVKSVPMDPSMIQRLKTRANAERRPFAQIARLLIEAGERAYPYPSLPEAPADTDEVE